MMRSEVVVTHPVKPMLTPTGLQRQTLRLYGELISRRPNYGGQLVFTSGAGASATGLPAAVSIAGGVTLALDPDAATVKSVFRSGGVDFVVNTLDEALRVLKNELRKHTPLSVALTADPSSAMAEMAERGVQPDLRLDVEAAQAPAGVALQQWLAARGWSEQTLPAATTADLRALDARLLETLPPDDTVRRAWLQRIPHYQRPTPNSARVLWLSSTEATTWNGSDPQPTTHH
jgi:urocanate hydratase